MEVDGAEDADRHALAMLAAPDDDNVDAVTTAQRLDSASRERSALERSAGDALLENEHMYEPAGSSFRIERVFESISRERRQVLAEIEAQRQAQRRAKERKKSRFADVKRPARGFGGNVLTSGGSKSNNSTAGALPEDADDADDADDTSASDYINMMLMQPDHLVFNKYTRFFLDEELESLYQEYTARNWFNRARGHMAFWMCFHVLVYVLYFILPGSGFRGMAQFDRNYESFLEWLQWAYLFMAVPFAAMPADRNPCQSHWRAIVCTIVILFNFGLQMWIGAACDSAVKKFQQTVDDTLVCPKDGQNDTSSTQKDMVSLTVHLYTGALVQILAVFSSIFSFIFVISVRLEFVQVMLVGVGTIISYILVLGLYQLQVEWMTAYAYGVSIVLLFVLSYSSDRTNRRSFLTNFQVEKENESLKSSLNKAEAALMNDAACDSEKRAVATILGVSDTRHLEMIRIPFADLKFLQAIGRGAMGDVIKAKYFGTDVVCKRMRRENISESSILSFREEIELMSCLRHPNIVQFIGASWDNCSNLCIVMEYMENGDMHGVLHSNIGRSFTWSDPLLKMAIDVVQGMLYLHSQDPPIVHRDLKSVNVLCSMTFGCKVGDFGLSRRYNKDVDALTTLVGTPFWLAPEIIRNERYGTEADVYSFGIVLTELETRKTPYHDVDETGLRVLMRIAQSKLRPTLPTTCLPERRRLINDCLVDNPTQRPTFATVLRRLQGSVQQEIQGDAEKSTLERRALLKRQQKRTNFQG